MKFQELVADYENGTSLSDICLKIMDELCNQTDLMKIGETSNEAGAFLVYADALGLKNVSDKDVSCYIVLGNALTNVFSMLEVDDDFDLQLRVLDGVIEAANREIEISEDTFIKTYTAIYRKFDSELKATKALLQLFEKVSLSKDDLGVVFANDFLAVSWDVYSKTGVDTYLIAAYKKAFAIGEDFAANPKKYSDAKEPFLCNVIRQAAHSKMEFADLPKIFDKHDYAVAKKISDAYASFVEEKYDLDDYPIEYYKNEVTRGYIKLFGKTDIKGGLEDLTTASKHGVEEATEWLKENHAFVSQNQNRGEIDKYERKRKKFALVTLAPTLLGLLLVAIGIYLSVSGSNIGLWIAISGAIVIGLISGITASISITYGHKADIAAGRYKLEGKDWFSKVLDVAFAGSPVKFFFTAMEGAFVIPILWTVIISFFHTVDGKTTK